MSNATGWACRNSQGTVLVNTVSDTRRGAIVNYLVAEKSIPVFKFHTDQDIENMWAHFGKYADCRTVEIAFQEQRGAE